MRAAAVGRLCVIGAAVALWPVALLAQQPSARQPSVDPADTVLAREAKPRTVSGRIVRPRGSSTVPVAGVWVVVHRVGADRAAPLDSTRTTVNGAYALRYTPTGLRDALYFVSVRYATIAYFSPPLRNEIVSGADAEITVYDTTSATLPLRVRGRHLIVAAPRADGEREVIEVYELSNDTSVTGISPDERRATWAAIVPALARDFRAGEGDVPPDAIRLDSGRVISTAPMAPGLKQLSYSYRLPASAFPLSLPIERNTDVLEVLLEEPTAAASGAKLGEPSSVAVEGRAFRRYLAQDIPASAVVRVTTPVVVSQGRRTLYASLIAIAVGAALLIALAVWGMRRGPRRLPVPSARVMPVDEADLLAHTIAEKDAEFERMPSPSEEERAAHERERIRLKTKLAELLAAKRRPG
ncbi:MAG: hypothetical protein M3081_08660 [Gemmatimonadota bacterium]|nr:hypothetical protein [Gemmatimonadota bacterium]